jgi:hypothetical protein
MAIPHWLEIVSAVSLATSGICAIIIALDIITGHGQHMGIMNIVWPATALYFGPLALWAYSNGGV